MKLSIIIVSYNTRELLRDCLQCVQAEDAPGVETLVVDNASTDGSAEMTAAAFPSVRLIRQAENTGFARANNAAFAHCRGEYLLLLNSDTRLVPGALAALIAFGETHREAGAWGPRLLNSDGSLQPSCYRFPTPARAWLENLWLSSLWPDHPALGDYRRWAHDTAREVDFVVGAALVARREVMAQVGGLDERFFLYSEETDWCWRIRRAGWKVMFTPDASVIHLGGGSASDAQRRSAFFESLDRYERKHHGISGLVLLRAAMVIGSLLRLPLWAAAFTFRPAHRTEARAKLRLHSWLLCRQALYWPRFGARTR